MFLRIKLPLRVADCARVQQQKAWPELVRLPFILASELAAATNMFHSDLCVARSLEI